MTIILYHTAGEVGMELKIVVGFSTTEAKCVYFFIIIQNSYEQ